jgi:hypothetical protein
MPQDDFARCPVLFGAAPVHRLTRHQPSTLFS